MKQRRKNPNAVALGRSGACSWKSSRLSGPRAVQCWQILAGDEGTREPPEMDDRISEE